MTASGVKRAVGERTRHVRCTRDNGRAETFELLCLRATSRAVRIGSSAAWANLRHVSKKHLGRHAEQDLPDRLEMGAACLDLLRKRVHVAEAALERAAREDR